MSMTRARSRSSPDASLRRADNVPEEGKSKRLYEYIHEHGKFLSALCICQRTLSDYRNQLAPINPTTRAPIPVPALRLRPPLGLAEASSAPLTVAPGPLVTVVVGLPVDVEEAPPPALDDEEELLEVE
jgi:hypothetical protein